MIIHDSRQDHSVQAARVEILAIPTEYGGAVFRSRLEAHWAAFFDLAGWQWDYEPIDTRGWSPDFILPGTPRHIFVEVKPALWSLCDRYLSRFSDMGLFDKVYKSLPKDAAGLLLGVSPIANSGNFFLGMCSEYIGEGHVFDLAVMQPNPIDYCSDSQGWEGRISGDHSDLRLEPAVGQRLWREAGARVQWKGVY